MVAVNRGRSQRKEVAKITHPKSLQKTRKHVHAEDSDYRGECESEDADESESEYSGNTESETSSSEAEIADARTQSLNMREAQIDERNMSVAEKRKRAQAKQDDFYTERLPLAWRKKVPPAGPKALLKSFRNPSGSLFSISSSLLSHLWSIFRWERQFESISHVFLHMKCSDWKQNERDWK